MIIYVQDIVTNIYPNYHLQYSNVGAIINLTLQMRFGVWKG